MTDDATQTPVTHTSKMRLTPAQKRMREIIASFQHYVATYSRQEHFDTYSDKTFVLDMLYGIGQAFGPEFSFSQGFDKFRALLRDQYLNGTG